MFVISIFVAFGVHNRIVYEKYEMCSHSHTVHVVLVRYSLTAAEQFF